MSAPNLNFQDVVRTAIFNSQYSVENEDVRGLLVMIEESQNYQDLLDKISDALKDENLKYPFSPELIFVALRPYFSTNAEAELDFLELIIEMEKDVDFSCEDIAKNISNSQNLKILYCNSIENIDYSLLDRNAVASIVEGTMGCNVEDRKAVIDAIVEKISQGQGGGNLTASDKSEISRALKLQELYSLDSMLQSEEGEMDQADDEVPDLKRIEKDDVFGDVKRARTEGSDEPLPSASEPNLLLELADILGRQDHQVGGVYFVDEEEQGVPSSTSQLASFVSLSGSLNQQYQDKKEGR